VENEVANCKPLFVFVCLSSWLSLVSLCLCIFSSLCLFACLRSLLALSLSAWALVDVPVCRLFVCRPSLPLFLCIFVSICMAAVFRLFLCISVHLCVCVCVCLYVCLSLFPCFYVCLSIRSWASDSVSSFVCVPTLLCFWKDIWTNKRTDRQMNWKTNRKENDRQIFPTWTVSTIINRPTSVSSVTRILNKISPNFWKK